MRNTSSTALTSNFNVRKVKVNRTRKLRESLDATEREQSLNNDIMDSNTPKGDGDEVEVVFFKPDLSEYDGNISDDDLEKEFELRSLKPADPISVAAVNEAEPTFADDKPHGTHWKDAAGNWCYVVFSSESGVRKVNVNHSGANGWGGFWWLAGVHK